MKKRVLWVFWILLLLSGCGGLQSLQRSAEIREIPPPPELSEHWIRGAFAEGREDYKEAVYQYQTVMMQDTASLEVRRALLNCYLQLKEFDSFLKLGREVVRRDPGDRETRALLVFYYRARDEYGAMEPHLEWFRRHEPERWGFWSQMLLEARYFLDDTTGYVKVFHEMLAKGELPDPEFQDAYLEFVVNGKHRNRELRRLRRLAGRFPREPAYQLLLAEFCTRAGNLNAARGIYERLREENTGDLDFWRLEFNFLFTEQQDSSAALALAREGAALFPDSSVFNYLQAFVLEGRGELDAAEKQLLAGIGKAGDREGWYLLSDFYLNHGPREKLLQTYETIISRVDSTDALILNNYAYTLVEDPAETTPELLQKALVYSRRALEMEPDNGSYLDTRGWIYYQLGNLEAAREDLERALELDGRNPVLLEHLAAVVKNSDPRRARRLLAEAQRLRSRNSGGESEETP